MQNYPAHATSTTARGSVLATNKVLRNTYMLLGATLLFSAAMAGVSMALNLPTFGLFTILIYFGLLYAVTKTQNSGWGILWTFALKTCWTLTCSKVVQPTGPLAPLRPT